MMRVTRHGLLALTCAFVAAAGVRAGEPTPSSPREAAVPAARIVPESVRQIGAPVGVVPANHVEAPVETPKGSLVIIGGALRTTDSSVLSEVINLAGGPGATIAVVPTASSVPKWSGERMVEQFEKLGAKAFVVPLGLKDFDVDYRDAAKDPELVARVKGAGGVYFTGGSQVRITKALYTPEGENTPLLDAVWSVYRRGGVVAGSSAGAAIMSRVMFSNPKSILTTLHKGVRMGAEIDRGLGFLDGSWFVEQHCLVRGRFARALVAMQAAGVKYGVGIDEDSAAVVRNGAMTMMGYKGAIILDLSEATRDPNVPHFNAKNVKMSYLDRGDSIDLKTLAITPAPFKTDAERIDPSAEGFRPSLRRPVVANDILTNATICTLMSQALVHQLGEAVGLAYDGAAARDGQADGFEFRLYRGNDTCGWCCDEEGYDSFTVANIRVDVQPVTIAAPLYSYLRPKPADPAKPETKTGEVRTAEAKSSDPAPKTTQVSAMAEPSAAGK